MITNLIFKRTVNIEGSSKVEMKIVEIDIPGIKSNEGWTLVSNADKVTVTPTITREPPEIINTETNKTADPDKAIAFLNNLMGMMNTNTSNTPVCNCAQISKEKLEQYKDQAAASSVNIAYKPTDQIKVKDFSHIKEYESSIKGTACLIRRNDTIQIAYREGKHPNMNTPNRICITDHDKQNFFNAVRAENQGNNNIKSWKLSKKNNLTGLYDKWNQFMDDEYVEQREEYVRKESMKNDSNKK